MHTIRKRSVKSAHFVQGEAGTGGSTGETGFPGSAVQFQPSVIFTLKHFCWMGYFKVNTDTDPFYYLWVQGARGFPGTPGPPGLKGHRVSTMFGYHQSTQVAVYPLIRSSQNSRQPLIQLSIFCSRYVSLIVIHSRFTNQK